MTSVKSLPALNAITRVRSSRWKRMISPEAGTDTTISRPWRNKVSLFEDREKIRKLFGYLFFALLAIVMIRITTGDADSLEARLARTEEVASGDAVKQVIYFLMFFVFLGMWLRAEGLRFPKCLSVLQYILIAWIVSSVSWAVDPAVSIRRSVLLVMVVTMVSVSVDEIGPKRSRDILTWLIALCIGISLACVPFFKFAIHQATEADQSLVGAWRGIFVHKNTAGAVTAAAIIIFLHRAIEYRRWYYYVMVVLSLIFLWGTKSKTPAGLMPIALAIGFTYQYAVVGHRRRWVFAYAMLSLGVVLLLGYLTYAGKIAHVLGDPTSFTGRAGLWQAVLGYSRDHLWLGAGYSSLWGVTGTPPILPYTTAPAQEFMIHSHSGYLELLGTIGLPGLLMALASAIFYPLFQLFSLRGKENRYAAGVTLSVFIFCMLENFLESQLYTRDREIWVILFIYILALQLTYIEQPQKRYARKTPARPALGLVS